MPVQPIRDPKARQWLDLLAYAEGTDKSRTGQGYNVMFGGGTFNDLRRHPDVVVNRTSAAAGRYQFMPSTWSGVSKKLGLSDFGPAAQDLAAVELMRQRGVDPYKDPVTPQTVAKLAPEWASLPTLAGKSYYNQPVKSFAELQQYAKQSIPNFPRQSEVSVDKASPNGAIPAPIAAALDVKPFDFNTKLEGVLLSKLVQGVSDPSEMESLSKYSNLMAQADELELEGGDQGSQLADILRSQASSTVAVGPNSVVDPTEIASSIVGLQDQEAAYYEKVKRIEETLKGLQANQAAQAVAVNTQTAAKPAQGVPGTTGPVRFAGVQITSEADPGQPGFDFVVAGGKRGAPFVSPVEAEVLRVSKSPGEYRLEEGDTRRGYGNAVELRFRTPQGKEVDTLIAHFDEINPSLKPGMKIPTGYYLGKQGRSGSTTGAHVSMDFFDPGKSTASAETLQVRNQLRDTIRKGLPYSPSPGMG
jgi:muramidase (phage lysozyme)